MTACDGIQIAQRGFVRGQVLSSCCWCGPQGEETRLGRPENVVAFLCFQEGAGHWGQGGAKDDAKWLVSDV